MKKYRVTLKTTYEVDATDVLNAENIARVEMEKDGIESLGTSVAEVKSKVVVEEDEEEVEPKEKWK